MKGVEGDTRGEDVLPVWAGRFVAQVPQIVPPLLVLNTDRARGALRAHCRSRTHHIRPDTR